MDTVIKSPLHGSAMNAETSNLDTDDLPLEEAPVERISAEVAQMEDTVRLAGIGIEDLDTGSLEEANIIRTSGTFSIQLHRNAPHRAWVLQHALAFIQSGHPRGLRADSFQPGICFEITTPPLSS